MSFLNVYAPPIRSSPTDGRTDSFSPSILPSSRNLFILGDFNCHHPLWDSRGTSDPRGEEVFDWVISSDLLPLNDPDTPIDPDTHPFPCLSQRPCVAEPEATSLSSAKPRALWSFTRPFALPSFPLNSLRLPPTSPHPLPLVQTKLPIPCIFLALAWIFFSTSSIFLGLHIPFLPSGRHLLLFPYIRWENLSTLLLPFGLSLSPPAYESCLNASFYPVFSFFWDLIPFFLPAWPVSALDGLHSIKFCTFLSPSRMGLTNPGRALGRSCLLSISRKLLTVSGMRLFSTNLFRLASLLALLVGLNLSFLIGALVWFFKITKAVPFESVEVFPKDPFLALYFSLSSLVIFRPLCLLLSAALFTLTIWPFGPPPPRSLRWWRPIFKFFVRFLLFFCRN